MKLRNKKTGEIAELVGMFHNDGRTFYRFKDEKGIFKQEVHSLLDLSDCWEDYEEPKEYWYIDDAGVIQIDQVLCSEINMRKSIGNYYDTREEAEKACDKLKAWKRLKDEYDFKFTGWKRDEQYRGDFIITAQDWNTSDDKLLDLLFGGEE